MTLSLVDSNIIIDILEDNEWSAWSERQVLSAAELGQLIINQIVLAETATYFENVENLDRNLAVLRLVKEELPWRASIDAGLSHSKYRKQGGMRDRVLPDFLIGAHAAVKGYRLLTRDGRRYRSYFPKLDIIAPDTHP
jgi:predicted nucleic acid-binding protein